MCEDIEEMLFVIVNCDVLMLIMIIKWVGVVFFMFDEGLFVNDIVDYVG